MGDFSKEIKSTFKSEKIKAMLNIVYTANWISRQQTQFFKPYGISPQQYNILRILRGEGKQLSVQTIKDRMVEQSPNATRMMDKLNAKSLIDRVNCEVDRRVVHVLITKKGLELLATIDTEFKSDYLENLTNKEANNLNSLLDKIR